MPPPLTLSLGSLLYGKELTFLGWPERGSKRAAILPMPGAPGDTQEGEKC